MKIEEQAKKGEIENSDIATVKWNRKHMRTQIRCSWFSWERVERIRIMEGSLGI